jgi:hypothetical protein
MNLHTASGGPEGLIYLFSSAPPDRPNYKRGVLDALCYPNGHQLELSYKKSYLQPPLFDKRSSLKGVKGAIVFVDFKRITNPAPEHLFIPIRFVNVLEVSPKEEAKTYRDTTRVYVRVELQDLISYESKSDADIKNLAGRPIPPSGSGSGGTKYFYVVNGPNVFPHKCDFSQRDVWDQLVGQIAQATTLKNCVFLSAGHVRPFVGTSVCDLLPRGDEQKAYDVRPNTVYRLDLRVYEPGSLTQIGLPEIKVLSSSDLISVSRPFATAVGGPEDNSVLIACKRTVESTLATLVVDVTGRTAASGTNETFGQPAVSTDVVASKLLYLLSMQPPKAVVAWFVFLIFLGFFLTSTSKDFYSDWVSLPERWAVLSKVAGAMCLASAGFLAFRKLPSGS